MMSAPLSAADPALRPVTYDPLPEGARACLGSPRMVTTAYPGAVAFSPDGKTLATANNDGSVRLWDVATGTEDPRFTGHTQGSPD
jgi:WD40 repeat protein